MNRIRGVRLTFAAIVLSLLSSPARADDYAVSFAPTPHPFSLRGQVSDYNYSDPATPTFRNWGSSWSSDNPNGSQITNASRVSTRKMVSIHIKINSDGDSFIVTPSSGGGLFREISIRKVDGKIVEAVFSGAAVAVNRTFWNQVSPGTPDNPYAGFLGYWSDKLIQPSGSGWTKIYPRLQSKREGQAEDKRWEELLTACPNSYRTIQAYSESRDGKTIVFLSQGRLFLYDVPSRCIYAIEVKEEVPVGANRITFDTDNEGATAVVWFNGRPVAKSHLLKLNPSEALGRFPERVSLK